MTDLKTAFQVERIDQSELAQLLQVHFGGAAAATIEEVQYGRPGEPTALRWDTPAGVIGLSG